MSDEKNNKEARTEEQIIESAFQYGTINTAILFDRGSPSLKISRLGKINIRIPYSYIIWGVSSFVISLLLFGAIISFITDSKMAIFVFTIAISVFMGIVGAKIGSWSPMKKHTGEDLITYVFFMLRRRISTGGKKISKTKRNSKIVGIGDSGTIVDCEQWLGTQPLYDAPPGTPYSTEDGSVFSTDLDFYPHGEKKIIPNELYSDGLFGYG